MIANKVRSAGLADILGSAGTENVQGETQQKLDIVANEIIVKAMDHGGRLCAMASEEEEEIIPIPEPFKHGKYVLLFDPLDGSSNIDVNVPVGTIFSVMKKVTHGPHGVLKDMLQPGSKQVAAGYVIYGSSTMLVYTTGHGAHGFTLDPSIGEFLLSHPDIRIPEHGRYLSVNGAYEQHWSEPVQALMRALPRTRRQARGDERALRRLDGRRLPPEPARRRRVRVSAELEEPGRQAAAAVRVQPALVHLRAGGRRRDSTAATRMLDVQPTSLHQRTAIYVGSRCDVEIAREMLGREAGAHG